MVAFVRSILVVTLFAVIGGPTLAAESVPSKDQKSTEAAPPSSASVSANQEGSGTIPKKDEPVIRGRIPRGWGELELSGEQKTEIYQLQEKHRRDEFEVAKELKALRERARELNKKLDAMKAASDAELKAILTPSQREKLSKKEKKTAPADEQTHSPSK